MYRECRPAHRTSIAVPERISNLSIDPLVDEDLSAADSFVPVVPNGKNSIASGHPGS